MAPRRAHVLLLSLLVVGCGSSLEEDVDPIRDSGPVTRADTAPAPSPDSGAVDEDTGGPVLEDAGADTDTPKPTPPGEPISVPTESLEKWVYVPIEGMRCGDGSPSGVGVNFTNESRELVVWFQGNGVCYDALTCNLYKGLLKGLGSDPIKQMFWGNAGAGEVGVFNRKDAANPFKKASFIVFPHCTVDGHTADKDSDYLGVGKVYQHGYANVTNALPRIVATFADATRIVVAGFSAGGIGATANYHQIAEEFAPYNDNLPFLINDCGPILRQPYLSKGATDKLRKGWGLDETIGKWCPSCMTEGVGMVYKALAELHPGLRSAQLSSHADSVTSNLYRLLNSDGSVIDGAWLKKGLDDHASWSAGWTPGSHRVFYFPGDQHGSIAGSPMVPGVAAFLDAQLAGGEWSSVQP